jgi:hypothetical protein
MDLLEGQFRISFEQRNVRTVRSLESSNKKVGEMFENFLFELKMFEHWRNFLFEQKSEGDVVRTFFVRAKKNSETKNYGRIIQKVFVIYGFIRRAV